jgi:DNA-binding GntR family transcriptional regulator
VRQPDFVLPPITQHVASLSDVVYEKLGEAILDGRLEPGARVRDVELADQLGVSRTPVREAMQRLERNGLIVVAANRWTRISDPSEKQRMDTQEFVGYVMGSAARIAVTRGSDADLDAALRLVDDISAASLAGEELEAVHLSVRLFQLLVTASGNSLLLAVLRESDLTFRRNLVGLQPLPSEPGERTAGYARLRAAIAERNAPETEDAIRALYGVQ